MCRIEMEAVARNKSNGKPRVSMKVGCLLSWKKYLNWSGVNERCFSFIYYKRILQAISISEKNANDDRVHDKMIAKKT